MKSCHQNLRSVNRSASNGDNTECLSCSSMRNLNTGECTATCPPGLLSLDSHWCIQPDECRSRNFFTLVDEPDGRMAPRQCVASCPPGYRTHTLNLTCTSCPDGVCKRDCRNSTFHLRYAHDFRSIRNCVRVKRLIVEIQSPLPSGGNDWESSLAYLEEIDDYLLITRNRYLTSLKFFSRLRLVRGLDLFEKKYALFVHTNPRLRNLWPFHLDGLRVDRGGIKFFENPQLCFQLAEKLVMNVLSTSNHRQDIDVELSYNYNGFV